MVLLEQIKKLRQETNISAFECKKALEMADGDIEKAKEFLKKWEKSAAEKKTEREIKTGLIESYIHQNGRVGVLLDIRCESDFVVRSEEFKKLAHELVLQIAAVKPLFVKEEDIPKEILDRERKVYEESVQNESNNSKKPQEIHNKIIEGKLKKYKEEISLMSQFWIKDPSKRINDLINETIGKTGENIIVKRFARYEI